MSIERIVRRLLGLVLSTIVFVLASCASESGEEDVGELEQAATVPTGFTDETLVTGLSSPTAMAFAPDGRLFICQQGGQLRVFKSGALLSTPFLTVTVNSSGERGLLGVAFDPNFATNNFVYVYYTATSPAIHNRISRFTANGDVAVAGSETVLMDLENLSSATNHNGGAMHFGPDGKLYIAVGENANRNNAATLANRLGKMLRINSDGSIPTDNPFFNTAMGVNRSIWALGLRNPFTFAFQRGTTRLFINDVGESTWEEINDGIAGSNYGWPTTEGPTTNPSFRSPLFSYQHGTGSTTGCAITGGTFYNPTTVQFPSSYVGKYFFADFCSNWIRVFDPAAGTAQSFASAVSAPVDLKVGSDGLLYYLARGAGAVGRIRATSNQPPSITAQPANRTVAVGQTATFSVSATGSQPLSYQWQRGTTNIAGATSSSYSLVAASGDNGATFRVVVSNAFGTVTSSSATLTVTTNAAPVATITAPASGAMYSGGDTINYSGTGTDAEDGTLPASAFTWEVVFHHATHTHPFMPPTSGATSGSFTIPRLGEVATDVFYRIHLTVRDSIGLTHTVTRDVSPRVSTISLRTNPAGLQVTLDGTPVTTPADVANVVGNTRQLGVVSPQTVGGTTYTFSAWSDGGAATHNINVPSTDTTYTATYTASIGGLTGEYYDNIDFTNLRVTRTDATVNFNFGSGSPDPLIAADTFSVRWTGTITPQFSQVYTLYTTSDDGIRVTLDGAVIINNFTDHPPTENSGVTAVLSAGQAYPIQIDFYENGGGATATLSWSSASQPKQIVPQSRLSPSGGTGPTFPIRINFQLAGAPTPMGYVPDTGLTFGTRSGLSFGWNISHTDVTRDRNINANQLLDTLCHFHSGASWEIALPSGTYNVLASIGDPGFASTHTLIVEGVTYWSARTLAANQFLSNTSAVTVSDGRLTVTQGSAADKSTRINYIEIHQP
ncbi:MAG TPA: PQQ-dependent sugar dehydrogenase [Polyangiaceae bacterium]|nr:PQQ-dependent sugar dehydrogenase [Polyangiaceae bacterium]